MKVMIICSAGGAGVAGHHFSVRDISRSFQAADIMVDVVLIVLDEAHESSALKEIAHTKIVLSNACIPAAISLSKRISEIRPDAILCFDEYSVRAAIVAAPFKRNLIVSVKPGWVNSDSWSSAVQKFALFTRENYDYYKSKEKYKNVEIAYIPNRVTTPHLFNEARAELRAEIQGLHEEARIIMCPVRIDKNKSSIINSAINLYEDSRFFNDHELVIIGANQSPEYLHELELRLSGCEGVHICTDDRITSRLSCYIGAADVVVAAGRTLAEALLIDKTVFVARNGCDLPTLVSPENFYELLYFNFTERNGLIPEHDHWPPEVYDGQTVFDLARKELGIDGGLKRYKRLINSPGGSVTRLDEVSSYFFSIAKLLAVRWRKALQSKEKMPHRTPATKVQSTNGAK